MLVINHYTLDVTLEFQPVFFPHSAPGQLQVKALLQVENAGPEPASALPLLFYRLHAVSGVSVNGQAARVTSRIVGLEGIERHQVNAVTIQLPEALPPGAICRVSLEYGGVTAGAREVWPYIWDAVTRDYTLLRPEILWYPVAAMPDRESESRASYRLPKHFDVTVHLPEGYTAAAPGLVSAQDGVARFRTVAPRERFDLAIVQIPPGWGSQNTPHLILQQAASPDNWHAAAEVLHEVSHFWTPSPADPPRRFSDEALASFFQALLVGDLFGPEKADEEMANYQRAVDHAQGASEIRFLDEPIAENLHTAVWYAKEALALNSLRDQLGEERFWPLLKEYTMAEKATTEGFVALLKRREPGPETEAFVRTWFG